MDIVHFTLDSPHIDRRILLISRSLEKYGHKTKILTPYAETEVGFENIEIVNVCKSSKKAQAVISLKERFKKYLPVWMFEILKKFYKRFLASQKYIPFFQEMTQKALEYNADIYIANDLPTLPMAFFCCQQNKVPIIYDSHEFYTEQIALSKGEKKYLKSIEKELIGNCRYVITINEDISKLFEKTYGMDKLEVIYNATAAKTSEKKYLHNLISIPKETKIILFQGKFMKYRNIEKLPEIARHLEKSVLVLLGWGELLETLQNLSRKIGILDQKIFFIDKISQNELLSYTSSASLGIIPYPAIDLNTKYCTPNKLFEFINAGLPIIANQQLCTIQNIITRHNIGLVLDFSDAKQVACVVEKTLENQNQLAFWEKNLQKAQEFFSWENQEKILMRILEEL